MLLAPSLGNVSAPDGSSENFRNFDVCLIGSVHLVPFPFDAYKTAC